MEQPYTITGPARLNIFAPVPRILPSVLNSTAGDTTEFAKPVMGTAVPAPAYFAIFEKVPVAVRIAVITIRVVGTANFTSSSVKPMLEKAVLKICPKQHIDPPKIKAKMQSFKSGDLGVRLLTNCW